MFQYATTKFPNDKSHQQNYWRHITQVQAMIKQELRLVKETNAEVTILTQKNSVGEKLLFVPWPSPILLLAPRYRRCCYFFVGFTF